MTEAAEELCRELEKQGIEVLYDDRGEKAGSMFSDADLIGIPLRVIVSPKTLADGEVEFKFRGAAESTRYKYEEICDVIKAAIAAEMAKYV